MDNLSAHTGADIRRWVKKNKVELCLTPTYASWANPIEAHFGPLRQFTLANSNHPNHTVQTRALHAYLRWRNANARHPDILAVQRRKGPPLHVVTLREEHLSGVENPLLGRLSPCRSPSAVSAGGGTRLSRLIRVVARC